MKANSRRCEFTPAVGRPALGENCSHGRPCAGHQSPHPAATDGWDKPVHDGESGAGSEPGLVLGVKRRRPGNLRRLHNGMEIASLRSQ